jgi:NAD(P)-dependent dehydrogenase (short-subunit alcohol dehydrogenase family)
LNNPIISQFGFKQDALAGETVIITGAGGGIGIEVARALLWLGANVIIAEINATKGESAAEALGKEFDIQKVLFVQADVGDESSVQELYRQSIQHFSKVDAVINNATIAVLGKVVDVPIEKWDESYRVNLRGPVLMARAFLPDMLSRHHGTFVCVSSTGTAYLGGYESFKAAQVHLANTLDAELEGTGVIAYTIGPGLVPTQIAISSVNQLAPLLGMTVKEFYELNKNIMLTPEEAGVGFAISLVYAERFKGTEISSIQALKAADINYGSTEVKLDGVQVNAGKRQQAASLCERVHQTLKEQSEGWKHRSIFERQWVIRDFRKTAGMSAEEWLAALEELGRGLKGEGDIVVPELGRLAGYYNHLAEVAKGYEKDASKLEENLRYLYSWRDEVAELEASLK